MADSSNNVASVAIVIIVVLAVLGVGYFLMYGKTKPSEPTKIEVNVPTPSNNSTKP